MVWEEPLITGPVPLLVTLEFTSGQLTLSFKYLWVWPGTEFIHIPEEEAEGIILC